MTRDEVLGYLRESNAKLGPGMLVMYADAYLQYIEATDNIRENGAVVLHPRTGAPISNPYLPIQEKARGMLRKMGAVKADRLWQ